MTPERWDRLKEIFAQAMEIPDPQRGRFVAGACGDDADLRERVQRLLVNHAGGDAGDFLSDPAITLTGDADPGNLFEPGQVVAGRFRIVRFIARGGMGEVYEAEDQALRARVALKTIHPRITGDAALDLFKQEILSARRVTHPNVCRIYDIAEHSDNGTDSCKSPVTLLTMELLEGPTLSRHLKEHGPFSHRAALPLIQQICAGLQAAHDAAVIHRDFKSSNVILTQGPHGMRPVITDFGLALPAGLAAEQPRAGAGTPGYMAPEQLEGGPATPATDVYALGVVIKRMTGDSPPVSWNRVIERCLEPDPSKRYQRPAMVATALQRSASIWPRSLIKLSAAAAGLLMIMWLVDSSPDRTPAPAAVNAEPTPIPPDKTAPPASIEVTPPAIPAEKQMVDRQVWDGPVHGFGSLSADGRYFTYADRSTGDLAIRDLRTGTNRLLTHKPGGWNGSTAYAAASVISPDNQLVAYQWYETFVPNFPRPVKSDVRVVSVASGDPKILLSAEETRLVQPYAWTPDSKNLLVFRALLNGTGDLVWVSAADGSVRVVKALKGQPTRASLSPDGRYIAYDNPGGGAGSLRDIFVLDVEEGQETVVVQNPGADQYPLWSFDGSQIFFTSNRTGSNSLWVVRIDRGKVGPEQLVKPNSAAPLANTRDGALYYPAGSLRQNVLVAEVNGEMLAVQPPALAAEQFVNLNNSAAWSPDGESLIYRSIRGMDGLRSLVVSSSKGRQDRVVPTNIQYVDTPILWFPDGRSVLVGARELPGPIGPTSLYRVDVASGEAQPVHRPLFEQKQNTFFLPNYYDLSRDGKSIVYVNNDPVTRQPNGQLDQFDLDTGNLVTLIRTGVRGRRMDSIAVSPDGTQVAYIVDDNMTRESSLAVVPLSGGESREVFRAPTGNLPGDAGIAWSPDQRYLLFVRSTAGQSNSLDVSIWRVAATGGDPQNTGITVHDASDTAVLAFPRVHPDGRRIAYTKRENHRELRVMENFLPKPAAR